MAEVPTYRALRAVDAILVDGRLVERSWSQAPRVRDFVDIYQPARPTKYPTEAAIVWDDVCLYIAFTCTDDEPWGTMTKRDDHLWEEEVVEVFLDPDGDGLNYAELEVSPKNVVVDLLVDRPRGDLAKAIQWNIAGLQTAVAHRAGGWDVEIAIPWTSLAGTGIERAPAAGDRWRAGLYRIKRPGGARTPDRTRDEYLAWSPTRADRGFHDPERFGYVLFE